jgi:hypothetical protein
MVMQRNSQVLPWRPQGLSDTLDASNTFDGAMASLQNLIPDPTTSNLWVPRPASTLVVNFSTAGGAFSTGFSSGFQQAFSLPPIGAISALKVIGNYAFGMVATAQFPGNDVPFVFNFLTNAFVPVQGLTAQNVPDSPPTTGDWTPPTMAMIGPKVIVTHPGFTGANNAFFGVLDMTNPGTPQWSATNMGGLVTFVTPPSAVFQFNTRAYFIVNAVSQPAVVFSDTLNPTNCTNANQVLTFGDNVLLTALGGLMLQNQSGGIIQSLVLFKGVQNIYQITGDAASTTYPLTVNSLNIVTGTLAPNTVVNTPQGLSFVSPDGVRNIDFYANVSTPIGLDGAGVTLPFINAVSPSRMAAACGGNVMRISVQNGAIGTSPWQEYWYDISRTIWSGPHTFPFSLLQPYNNAFVGQPVALPGQLWNSTVVQSSISTYVENGQQMSWVAQTPLLPDTDQMTNNCMTEATMDLAISGAQPVISVNAQDQNGVGLDSVQVTQTGTTAVWGAFVWGAADWGASTNALAPRQLQWTEPIIFTRISLQASGQSAALARVGAFHLRYQILRYTSSIQAAA